MCLIQKLISLNTWDLGSLVQFRGMAFYMAEPNQERILGYQLMFFNETSIEFQNLGFQGYKKCSYFSEEDFCFFHSGCKYIHADTKITTLTFNKQ